jgi:osmotically-inducible protein OsmY
VKAAHVDAKDIQANAFKVVSESGVVYLMGVVTQREGDRAAQVASRVSGVQRVVTVFEYVSEDELARIERRTR